MSIANGTTSVATQNRAKPIPSLDPSNWSRMSRPATESETHIEYLGSRSKASQVAARIRNTSVVARNEVKLRGHRNFWSAAQNLRNSGSS